MHWAKMASVVLMVLAAAGAAFAGPGVSGDPAAEAAVAMAEEGLTLFEARRWGDAYQRFSQANAQYPAVTLQLYMAHCKKNLGELREALGLYQQVASAVLPPDAKPQHHEAKATAAEQARELEGRVPTIAIVVQGTAAAGASVAVDGQAISAAEAGRLRLDPGTHTVEATAAGVAPASKTVVLSEGSAERVELTLGGGGESAAPSGEGSLVPAYVAFGVGGAALVLGIITGAASLSEVADLEERCQPDNHCPAADQDQADTANALATVSTVGFVLAGIGVAAGVGLVIWRPGGGDGDDGESLALRAGPGRLSLRGSF